MQLRSNGLSIGDCGLKHDPDEPRIFLAAACSHRVSTATGYGIMGGPRNTTSMALPERGPVLATVVPNPALSEGSSPGSAHSTSRPRPKSAQAADFTKIMAAAAEMFQPQELAHLAPRLHSGQTLAAANGQGINGLDPIAATEAIAYDFLAKGGKHSRPFITLAVYDALSGFQFNQSNGSPAALPDSVKRCALSIETFHKASLVHDDIQDGDEFRYGEPTLHRKFGTATAINVGDYLIGLGYRLITRETASLGGSVVGDILDRLADAHMKLSEGQGAELIWRDSRNKRLTPADALKIYALKTAPAFEAALHTGARLAGRTEKYAEPMAQFARNLGIAFQIINDLNDWLGDNHNKLAAAGDVLGGRPTVLWALAIEGLPVSERAELETIAARQPLSDDNVRAIRRLYETAGVFEKAALLVEKHQQRAETIAATIGPEGLQQLFYYLIDLVLERRQHSEYNGAWTSPASRA
jgi:geranylgeranyl diphosphate synthase, type II